MVSDNQLQMLICLFPDIRMMEPIFTTEPLTEAQWAEMECSHSSARAATKICGVLNTAALLIALLTEADHGAQQIPEFQERVLGLLHGEKTRQPPIQFMPVSIMFGKVLPEEQAGHNLVLSYRNSNFDAAGCFACKLTSYLGNYRSSIVQDIQWGNKLDYDLKLTRRIKNLHCLQ